MAPHSSTLAWKIPWIEEPGGLQSMGSLRVRHDRVTSLSLFTFMHWRRKWNPLQCSCLENPRDGGAWWAAVYGVAQSRTWLKWLSSSSRSHVTSHVESVELLSLLTIRVWQKDTIWGKWERLVSEYHCFCSKALFLLFQCLLGQHDVLPHEALHHPRQHHGLQLCPLSIWITWGAWNHSWLAAAPRVLGSAYLVWGPELHFYQLLMWRWCCWSRDQASRTSYSFPLHTGVIYFFFSSSFFFFY